MVPVEPAEVNKSCVLRAVCHSISLHFEEQIVWEDYMQVCLLHLHLPSFVPVVYFLEVCTPVDLHVVLSFAAAKSLYDYHEAIVCPFHRQRVLASPEEKCCLLFSTMVFLLSVFHPQVSLLLLGSFL